MASTICRTATDIKPLKRSFDELALGPPFQYRDRQYGSHTVALHPTPFRSPTYHSPKRRILSTVFHSSMLAQAAATMSGSFPSFMSVYDSEEARTFGHALQQRTDQTKSEHESFSHFPTEANKLIHFHSQTHSRPIQRRGSAASTISYSTESSPTTTSSTFDSPLVPDMPGSPSSSPESASSAVPPRSFHSSFRMAQAQTTKMSPELTKPFLPQQSRAIPAPAPEEPKKNVKNLTIDMRLPQLLRPSTSAGPEHPFSAPTSPLREPPKTGRKKPTNLTIRTPGFNQLAFPKLGGDIPPTPSHNALFHRPLASPGLAALASPTGGPIGGMQLGMPNIAQRCQPDSLGNILQAASGAGNLPVLREDEYQPPKSQEAPEQGYTEGPVRIYDSGVYLYLEPTAEEASKFDIVINCAKEIKDPFENQNTKSDTVVAVWRNFAGNRQSISEPQTAMSEISFKSAFEWPSSNSPSTPTATTPKRLSDSNIKVPEYLHVPWDHNSEILEDLYPLCQIIDNRVSKGKKVLIHCQLGVSRSASLIIAYGLFKGYQSSFHSMYMAVKERSRWVGPNMSLIYQLNDFCAKCAKGDYPRQSRAANPAWFIHSPDNAQTPTAAPIKRVEDNHDLLAKTSTSSLSNRPPLRLNKELPPVPLFSTDSPVMGSMPSARLSSLPIPAKPLQSTSPELGQPVKRSASRPLPLRQRSYFGSPMIIPPHRPRALQTHTFARPAALMDLAQQDVPESPSLFSPRASEFVAQPFGITTAGDLVTSAPKKRQPPPGSFPGGAEWRQSLRQSMDLSQEISKLLGTRDPRSPHHTDDNKEILRHIDDVL